MAPWRNHASTDICVPPKITPVARKKLNQAQAGASVNHATVPTSSASDRRIDQIDAAEAPAHIAQMDVIQMSIPGGDIEAPAIETHGAVGTALLALDLDAEG